MASVGLQEHRGSLGGTADPGREDKQGAEREGGQVFPCRGGKENDESLVLDESGEA